RNIKKILVANRGEIAIRVFRAATELGIGTVAIYSYEDRHSLHRYKADEAYCIGDKSEALKPYLDIEEIVATAKKCGADAIHPGYGFLSENSKLVNACDSEGVIFIGPSSEVIENLGNKLKAKDLARKFNIPVIEGSVGAIESLEEALKFSSKIGFPVLVKASSGGGGRGMRIAQNDTELSVFFKEAKSEAKRAFDDDAVFIEKYIENPKHIEIQIVADNLGETLHFFERDCSVQRRFQKVVEVAPAVGVSQKVKEALYKDAINITNSIKYKNAGTVEFLVDSKENYYFIEVNPRIQVEHTVTEEITGIDLVNLQILIADGYNFKDLNLNQEKINYRGVAIQCRITTEDPSNNFAPDYGVLLAYRSPGGCGIRLDAGSAHQGARISPFFDSLLVKVTARGVDLESASSKLVRALKEFRVRGVKNNIPFLLNVLRDQDFLDANINVNFLKNNKEIFKLKPSRNRVTKLLKYLADVTVNGNQDVGVLETKEIKNSSINFDQSYYLPKVDNKKGLRSILLELGPEKFIDKIKADNKVYYTDTTMRDAHQSLIATRVRTKDLLKIAPLYNEIADSLFSMEIWGGATFDVALRFLHECPFRRLKLLREIIPNIPFQMLLRGANAVGYKSYPDKVIVQFIEEANEAGIDIFRIFDSMNSLSSMKLSINTVIKNTNALAEACVCYTGNILSKENKKYTLQYYLDRARELEDAGAHILAIKDMAGLLTADASEVLIGSLKENISLPIHLHTHDTSSLQNQTYLKSLNANVDIVDLAIDSMSGLTSQPAFIAFLESSKDLKRHRSVDRESLSTINEYFLNLRELYSPFESGLKAGDIDVYNHEIPGGQYSNLLRQARSLGLAKDFKIIKENYISANKLLGDLVKVTPSSKVVGDLALFMTSNDLNYEKVLEQATSLSFPESVKDYFRGKIGEPYGGFPEEFRKAVLKDEVNKITEEPDLNDEDFNELSGQDYISAKLYPKVFKDYLSFIEEYGPVEVLPTELFFYGLEIGKEVSFELEIGKTIILTLDFIYPPDEQGKRKVVFTLNGQSRTVEVLDKNLDVSFKANVKSSGLENEYSAGLQGKLSEVLVTENQEVKKDQPLFVIEAMKMETVVTAKADGKIGKIYRIEKELVQSDDLILIVQ
ncbi:UNVERIFIED_CONTAM: hypothetical protein GTU68_060061, partial [Idotea baltica]|nr:hypothetical protein [Idotea baltica]